MAAQSDLALFRIRAGMRGLPHVARPPDSFVLQVYKSGGALSVKFIKPRWRTTDSGALAMDRAGAGFLEFAKASAESGSSPGERRYDWDRRVVSMSMPEHPWWCRV